MRLFRNDREAYFAARPSRFVIAAESGGEQFYCHCPNPGRLVEFTFPGEKLILEKNRDAGESSAPRRGPRRAGAPPDHSALPQGRTRKTSWTAAAVYHNGAVVPLCASRANRAAADLILPQIIPGMKNLRAEYRAGSSRFDFFAEDACARRHLIEVKACSLVEYGAAMFPDAPSARALKHLEELADLSGKGFVCHVVFVIMHGSPARFVPNFHTDPAFAAALSRYGTVNPEAEPGKVRIHAALLRSAPDGETVPVSAHIPVDLSFGALAEKNSGNYLFMLELPEARTLEVAALGTVQFEKGWYVYAGSAAKNLDQRIARHLRRVRKKKHWHIDWLTPYAAKCGAFPVRIARSVECDLARSLKAAGGRAIPRFGCSGCLCASSGGSHLYHFAGNPLQNRSFVDMLLRYRHRIALDSSPEP